ncbi:MAG: hypothetical protein PHE21_01860 [Candidatus Dojkabacteria bacterium]|nr:hypothetical protein [Candidatus Dojkabacteria bacterium]
MKKFWAIFVVVIASLVILGIVSPLMWRYWVWGFDINKSEDVTTEVQASANASASCNIEAEEKVVEAEEGDQCFVQAESLGIPTDIATYICTMPQNNQKAPEQMPSKSKVTFGSITFDSETRVWVLRNFIVPNQANYTFDHSGRERRILGAGFYTGSELSPVNGDMFKVCYDTTSDGCIPPYSIEFFQ